VFQAIGLFDVLTLTMADHACDPLIEVRGADLPTDNTLTKAYRLSREILDVHVAYLDLRKGIPMQAGLGGGSSDAAGLLRAMHSIKPAAEGELASVAGAVGADVPFFLVGGRARGTRYGDVIEALPDGEEAWYVIAKPAVGCDTAKMSAALDAEPRPFRDWPTSSEIYNDFEAIAPEESRHLIGRLKEEGAIHAGLSGSGSAVFGRFATAEQADIVSERLRSECEFTAAAPSLTRRQSLHITRLD
jgi:4-diphosphocytidyl-2-C-methyl-D-erythritol kinase